MSLELSAQTAKVGDDTRHAIVAAVRTALQVRTRENFFAKPARRESVSDVNETVIPEPPAPAPSQTSPVLVNWAALFRNCPMMRNCSSDFLRELQGDCERLALGRIFEKGAIIAEEQKHGQSMFLVFRGALEAWQKGSFVGFIGRGGFFDEGLVMGIEGRRKFTVRALCQCHLYEIQATDLQTAFHKCPRDRRLLEAYTMERRGKGLSLDQQGVLAVDEHASPRADRSGAAQLSEGIRGRSSVDTGMVAAASGPTPIVPFPPKGLRDNEVQARATSSSTPQWPRSDSNRCTTAEEEYFLGVVKESLRMDAQRGYLMPDAHAFGAQTQQLDTFGALKKGAVATMLDAGSHDTSNPINVDYLPPLDFMSPLQKRIVQRHFQTRVQQKRRAREACEFSRVLNCARRIRAQLRTSDSSVASVTKAPLLQIDNTADDDGSDSSVDGSTAYASTNLTREASQSTLQTTPAKGASHQPSSKTPRGRLILPPLHSGALVSVDG